MFTLTLEGVSQIVIIALLWTVLCICLGFSMGKRQIVHPGPAQEAAGVKNEPFSFVDEPGYVEDEILKEPDSGYRRIGGGKVEERLEDVE